MKKLYLIAIISICQMAAFGQKKYEMVVEKTDGTEIVTNVEDIVRTYFRERGNGNSSTEDKAPSEVMAVDLGLSVKWANVNLGASTPEDSGLYYAWGEVEGYNSDSHDFSWQTYKYYDRNSRSMLKYNDEDHKTVLDASDDAASVNWGGNWRTPTTDEFKELYEKCTVEWTQINGVNGCKMTSQINGNSIFLPGVGLREGTEWRSGGTGSPGYYWTASLSGASAFAYNLSVGEWHTAAADFVQNHRFVGFSVRPVQK
ncbi:MAG: hypothetical protein IJV25_07285 [Prevotella sp.]|nr:hypothetical protein [Prevotella sp.]